MYIESRGPFRIVSDHNNDSYSVRPFDKPNSIIRKFFLQDMYALPPQFLACDPIDLSDLRYFNTNYDQIKHSLKTSFYIESYNSMWFDEQPPSTKPPLKMICSDSLSPKVITDHIT